MEGAMVFIRGTRRPDRLNGTDRSDFIFALDGDDFVFAGAGNDFVDGGPGDDYLDGGEGNDLLIGGLGNDHLEGGRGNDVLVDSFIGAGVGPNAASRMQDDDVMNGGDGDDMFVSARGNDFMYGGNGNDTFMLTGAGLKTVIGGAGDDITVAAGTFTTVSLMFPPSEADEGISCFYFGGDGNDLMIVIGSNNPLDTTDWPFVNFVGGDGDDTAVFSGLFAGLIFSGGEGNDVVQWYVPDMPSDVPGDAIDKIEMSGGLGNDFFEIINLLDTPVRANIVVDGGDGNDTAVFSGIFAQLSFSGGPGDDILNLKGELSEPFEGTQGDFTCGLGNDFIEIIGPRDTPVRANIVVDGGDGDDTFVSSGWFADLTFFGGDGNDKVLDDVAVELAVSEVEFIQNHPNVDYRMGAGNDFIEIIRPRDTPVRQNIIVDGGDGDDTFRFSGLLAGNLTFDGGAGYDFVFIDTTLVPILESFLEDLGLEFHGGSGNDVFVYTGATVFVDTGATEPFEVNSTTLDGGEGNDTFLITGAGLKFVSGGAGDDAFVYTGATVFVDTGATEPFEVNSTTLDGGDGNDAIRVEMPGPGPVATVPPEISVFGGDGNDVIAITGGGRSTPERQTVVVEGGDGDDVVNAAGYDIAAKAPGVALTGGEGQDTLIGTNGNDGFNAGPGADFMTGGMGDDIFEYDAPDEGPDVISDFTPVDDVFHIDGFNFGGGLVAGALDPAQFVAASDPLAAGGQGAFLYDTDNGALAWDADGAGGNPAVTLAFLINLPALSASDFLIV
jgi:Ca2+-binding RTX toxin-like protein